MKNLIIVSFIVICQNVSAQKIQFERGYWMPKEYINRINQVNESMSKNELLNLLKPIESILVENNKLFVKTYKDEFKASKFEVINGKEILLKTVMINLAQTKIGDDPVLNKFGKNKFYLYRGGSNSMSLVIKGKSSTADTIQFTRYIDNIPIISNDVAPYQIKLSGKFDLYSSNSKKMNKNFFIKKDGKVNNSKILNAISLKDIPNIYTDVNEFYVVSELQFSNSKKEKVILKFNNSKTIFIYKNDQGHLGKILYLLKRVN